MTKAYLLLIGFLVVLVLTIGGYAFYKSTSSQTNNPSLPVLPITKPTSPSLKPSLAPATSTQNNQISLTLISPKNGTVLSGSSVQITGKTAPNVDVFVNDLELKSNASGNFTATVSLDEGENEIIVTAIDDSGSVAEQSLTITYTPTP